MSQSKSSPTHSDASVLHWLKSMPLFAPERRRKLAPFVSSLVIHAIILVLLAMWILPVLSRGTDTAVIIATSISNTEDREIDTEIASLIDVTGGAAESIVSSNAAVAAESRPQTAPTQTANVKVPQPPSVLHSSMHSITHFSDDALMTKIDVPVSTLPMHQHRGETRVVKANATAEIAATVSGDLLSISKEGDAIVVWMLDQSLSMHLDIQSLAEKLVGTLDEIEKDKSTLMMHYVVAFGNDVKVVRDSTPRSRPVATAIYNLPTDPSGVENTFGAVEWCVDNLFNNYKWKLRKERQKLLVLWTDESGDDYLRLENTIQKCLRANVRVEIIGPSAVLGAQTGYTAFTHPEDGRVYQLPVHRGPDSSFPQKQSLGYWHRGVPATYDELFRGPWPGRQGAYGGSNFESLLSGFSPYALTRLARQTGGRYTIYDRPGDRPPFELEAVREYLPNYQSLAEIEQQLIRQPLRQIVLASAAETWKSAHCRYSQPPLAFRPDFAGEQPIQYRRTTLPNKLRPAIQRAWHTAQAVERALAFYAKASTLPAFRPRTEYDKQEDDTEEQDRSAKKDAPEREKEPPDLSDMEIAVNETLLEQLYKQEGSKRWRAWCDLNMGRLLSVSVRLREYLLTANELASNINALNADTNSVWLTPAPVYRGGAVSEQRAAIAKRFLERCMEQNPNTPWSVMAARELRDRPGLTIRQRHVPRPVFTGVAPSKPSPRRPKLPNL